LEQANRAFEQALTSKQPQAAQGYYQQAIEAYEQLLAAGHENAKLHYNLGNAYFLRQDLGRAIAHYRRGLRFEPGNERLRANLRYARSQRRDHLEPTPDPTQALVTRVLFWLDDMALRTQITVALTGFVLFWICAALLLFRRSAMLRWLLAGTACLFLLFAASTTVVHLRHTQERHGVIVASTAPVRKGNGESYALQFPQPLHSGAEFRILEERGSWLHIRLPNGADGWVRQALTTVW
jgi:tetratricopeptide (TPR) repeat protein